MSVEKPKIITDESAGLSYKVENFNKPIVLVDFAKALGIPVIPAWVNIDEFSILSTDGIDFTEFHSYVENPNITLKTAAVAPDLIKNVFTQFPEDIIFIHATNIMSSYGVNAESAVRESGRDNISTFDSQMTSVGLALLVLKAKELSDAGYNKQQIIETLTDLKDRSSIFVTFKSLDRLKKSGRVSALQAAFGYMMHIYPILEMKDGLLKTKEKNMTWKKTKSSLMTLFAELGDVEKVAIVFSGDDPSTVDDVKELIEHMKTTYQGEILVMQAGPALAAHAGLGAIGFAAIKAKQT